MIHIPSRWHFVPWIFSNEFFVLWFVVPSRTPILSYVCMGDRRSTKDQPENISDRNKSRYSIELLLRKKTTALDFENSKYWRSFRGLNLYGRDSECNTVTHFKNPNKYTKCVTGEEKCVSQININMSASTKNCPWTLCDRYSAPLFHSWPCLGTASFSCIWTEWTMEDEWPPHLSSYRQRAVSPKLLLVSAKKY